MLLSDDVGKIPETTVSLQSAKKTKGKKSKKTNEDLAAPTDMNLDTQPFSMEEITLLRMQLRKMLQKDRNGIKPDIKAFKVPSKHPVFNGKLEKLEEFIKEMMLTHMEWVTGTMVSEHNPQFITKLVDYFDQESGTRLWFSNYATDRLKNDKILSWKRLVRDLRRDFSQSKQRSVLFNDFWFLEQGKEDIHIFIAKFKNAVERAKNLVTEELMVVGFLQGLREDVSDYVSASNPKTIENAQRLAVQYENTHVGPRNRRSRRDDGHGAESKPNKRSKQMETPVVNPKNDKISKGVNEIRALRKGTCFLCGVAGHLKDACQATTEQKSAHLDRIKAIKTRMHAKGP